MSLTQRGVQQAPIAAVLWHRKGVILFFLLAGLGGGYAFFTQQPETFSASAVIEVYQGQARSSTGSAVETVTETAPGVSFIEAEIASDAVLLSAVEMGQLTAFEGMSSNPVAVANRLRSGLRLRPATAGATAKDRTIVQVAFESNDPAFSTAAVNSIVSAYDDYLNGKHRETIDSVVGFFREARDTILPQLNDLEQNYTEFRATTPLEWSSNGEAVNPFRQEALTLEDALYTIRGEARQIDTKLRLIEESMGDQRSAVLALRDLQFLLDDMSGFNFTSIDPAGSRVAATGSPVARDAEIEIQEQLVPKVIQSDLLKSQFGERHPLRRELEREIEATRTALRNLDRTRSERQAGTSSFVAELEAKHEAAAQSLLRSYVKGLKKKRELLGEDIADLETRLADSRTRAHNLIRFETENASYTRRISRYQGMVDSFEIQLEKANLPLLTPGLEVEILRPAGMGQLIGPLLSRSLLMGVMLGAALGCLVGWLLDWAEFTFRSPEDVANSLDLPILAHLPLTTYGKRKQKKGKCADQPDPLDAIDRSITVVHAPHAQGSEAIRGVRTGLFCSRTRQLEFQVVLVTSAMPGDGKSTIAANLAASIAGAQKRVIIVDADLRRPTQSTLFGVDQEKGVTSVLDGECTLADAIATTAIEGLDVLPSGPKPSNPAEALSLPEFGELLEDLRQQYDMVIIDSPPVLACTDASVISSHADGALFVMRIGRNARPLVLRATQMLRTLQVNLLGVIVNAIGDSGYSATYASSWSTQYGGIGTEYGYMYDNSISDKYLSESQSQPVTIQGRKRRKLERVSH